MQVLQRYYETANSRNGVDQVWILKNSKELLDYLKSLNFNLITNIKYFDFSTLYTTIPHQKLKVVPHHKPHKILKFKFSENYITKKPPFHLYAWKI